MPTEDIIMAQENFMRQGGLFQGALNVKWKSGELKRAWDFHEYPKMLRLNGRVEKVQKSTQAVDKKEITWTEEKEVFDEVVVFSEADEERVLAGGKTSDAIEEERQGLIRRCRAQGINVDMTWSVVRLRRELGDALDAPAPKDDMAQLEAQLANLRKMAEMKAEIDRLQALVSGSSESDDLRSQLAALGVTPDKRWGVQRLRDELDAATAPSSRAA